MPSKRTQADTRRQGVRNRQMNKLDKRVKTLEQSLKQTLEGKQIYRENEGVALQLNTFNKFDVLDGLAQGVADTGSGATVSTGARIGNSINVKSLTLKMFLDAQNLAVSTNNPQGKVHGNYRVIVYNSPCGEALDETDILKNGSTTDQAIISHYKVNIGQGKMYDIWFDQLFCVSDANPCKKITFSKRWKNGKEVIYDGNATSPSNFRPRVLVIGDSNANIDMFTYAFKCRYEDL